jgi:hypothetical protein
MKWGCAMGEETGIENRLRLLIEDLAPNQTVRYDLLAERTNIARHRWVNWVNHRQALSLEMLEGFFKSWPEYAAWVATGVGAKPTQSGEEIKTIVLTRGADGLPKTNVPHVVSSRQKGTPPEFEWGYVGSGSRELAMNILYLLGLDEPEADYLSSRLAEEVISKVPLKGKKIPLSEFKSWLSLWTEEIDRKKNERLEYEATIRKHQEKIEAAKKKLTDQGKA